MALKRLAGKRRTSVLAKLAKRETAQRVGLGRLGSKITLTRRLREMTGKGDISKLRKRTRRAVTLFGAK